MKTFALVSPCLPNKECLSLSLPKASPSYFLMQTYDIIIIGAGPAGTAAAILTAEAGHHVLLLEKSRFPRHKLCGEFITPECGAVFARLGVRRQMLAAGAQPIRDWTIYAPDGRGIKIPIAWIAGRRDVEGAHAIGLTRAKMDEILLDRARALGVAVREGFHVAPKFERVEGLSLIEGRTDGATVEQFAAPVVLDASGRNGVFSKQIVRQEQSHLDGARLFGCKVHLRGIAGLGQLGEMYFFRDGYGGLLDVEPMTDGTPRSNLCFLTTEATLKAAKGDREKLLDLTLRTNPAAHQRLRYAEPTGEWFGTGPIHYGRKETMPGALALGDAGAFIDPFTGSGILLALSSGQLAADVINQSFAQGIREIDAITGVYTRRHRAQFGLRFHATAFLRSLAFKPLPRRLAVTLLSRSRAIARLTALSTRQRLSGGTAE